MSVGLGHVLGGRRRTDAHVEAVPGSSSMDEHTFVERVSTDMPPRPANHESIIATTLGRESPDDETAFELELGPNNCTADDGAAAGD